MNLSTKRFSIFLAMLVSTLFILTGCKEDEIKSADISVTVTTNQELKTVQYWMEHPQERRDFFVTHCKNNIHRGDDCKVLRELNYGEEAARNMYDSIMRERARGR